MAYHLRVERRSFDALSNVRHRRHSASGMNFLIKFIAPTANALPAWLLRGWGSLRQPMVSSLRDEEVK